MLALWGGFVVRWMSQYAKGVTLGCPAARGRRNFRTIRYNQALISTENFLMSFLAGKRILITGLLSNHSISYGVAKAMHREGAELAFTYQNDRFEERVTKMAAEFGSSLVFPCDVQSDDEITALFAKLGQHWDGLDGLVHSIAFAPGEALEGDFLEGASREAFRVSQDISAYSFVALAKAARPMMKGRHGALLTMTYLGADEVIDHYGMMGPVKAALQASTRYLATELGPKGIRVNAVSPGPLATRAASGIAQFDRLMADAVQRAPLGRLVDIADVGALCTFLVSDAARSMTGSTLYVDAGVHIMG